MAPKLEITRINDPRHGECVRLNMSIKTLFDTYSPDDDNFYQNLNENGIRLNCQILATPQDVEDYRKLDEYDWSELEENPEKISESEKKRLERLRSISWQLNSLIYEDIEFTDEKTGKKGLTDQFGNIVVPALFDSCRGATNLTEIDYYAVVGKDGKFYRTPRDGSGRLIDNEGYDTIYYGGEVLRDGKHGKVSVKFPCVRIPCEMDWLEYDFCYGIIFGKDNKLGFYDEYLHKYVAPEYSAFDISTFQFCRNGVWGWVSRETGEFFTEPVGDRYGVMIAASFADSYLSYDDKPKSNKEKQYIPIEEARENILKNASGFKKRLKTKLSSLLELPSLKFEKGFAASSRIVEAIRSLSSEDGKLIVSSANSDAAEIHISCSKVGRKKVYRLEWSPKNNAMAWYDARLPEITAFHQLIIPGKDTFSLHFTCDFDARQVHTIAKFIEYYYATLWQITEGEIIIN